MKKIIIAVLAMSWAAASMAVLLVYEPFNDEKAAKAVPTGWQSDEGSNNIPHSRIDGGSLNYPGLPDPAGNSLGLGDKTSDYWLTFTPTDLAAGETIYFSLLTRANVLDAFGSGLTFRLYDSQDQHGSGICIGRGTTSKDCAVMGFSINNRNRGFDHTGSTPADFAKTEEVYPTLKETYLIVGAYTRGSDLRNGTVRLWINPDSSSFGALQAPEATLAVESYQSDARWDMFRIGSNGSGSHPANWQIDELRIGTSWADVVPGKAPAAAPAAAPSAVLGSFLGAAPGSLIIGMLMNPLPLFLK